MIVIDYPELMSSAASSSLQSCSWTFSMFQMYSTLVFRRRLRHSKRWTLSSTSLILASFCYRDLPSTFFLITLSKFRFPISKFQIFKTSWAWIFGFASANWPKFSSILFVFNVLPKKESPFIYTLTLVLY